MLREWIEFPRKVECLTRTNIRVIMRGMERQNQWIPPEHYAAIRRRLDPRMAALCDLLRDTGYRVDDVLRSTVGEWRGKDSVTLYEYKTKKRRTVYLTEPARSAVRRLLSYRYDLRDDDPLCPARRPVVGGRPWLHRSTVYRAFVRASERAGLSDRGYTVHSLRKCYARSAYERTGSLLAVQRDLGHKSLETTLWYVTGSDIHL